MNKKLIFGIVPFVLVIALLGITGDVGGHDYLNIFEKTIDPGELGSRIDSCLLCHINPNGGGLLNSYGTDFANNTHNFTNIEQLDSDGDGFTNIVEIHARSFPGNASDFPVTPTLNSTLYGVEFYAINCQSCHNTLASSTMLGRTAAQIKIAINTEPAMSSLSGLSLANIQAIATALSSPISTSTTALNGTTLYSSYCAGCHRPLATSAKLGRTVEQIQTSITTVSSMSFLSSLSSGQLQDIANALAATSTPTPTIILDGPDLYAGNCAGCHNQLASTTKPGRTAAQILNSITTVSVMNSLSLTSQQLQAIADALPFIPTPTPTPTPNPTLNGATLYSTYCASCHNTLASTSKPGRTALQIQNSITSVSSMNSLSTLSSTQVQAIATAMAVAPTPIPTPNPTPTPTPTLNGATLYSTYCASCHNTLASSDVKTSSASKITGAISEKSEMRSISLSSTQIQAIATALAV